MLGSETVLSSQFSMFQRKSKKVIVIKSARINVLHILAEVITIFVSLREPILHSRQLGDYFPNQVASSIPANFF